MEFAEDVKSEWFCSDDPNIPMMPLSMQSCSNAQLMSFDQSESEISCVPTSFYQDDIDSMPMEKFDNSNTSGLDFSEKTPFMALNELFPCVAQSVQWENVTTPTGQLFFRCVASYEGQQFVGEGRNKKEAKQLMAAAALAQLPSAPIRVEKKRKRVESGGDVKTEDFASDEPATGRISPPPKKRAKVNWKEIHLRPGITPTSRLLVDKCGEKSPPWQVQTEFRTIAADQTLPVRFEAKITVDSRTFSSIGMTRKTANDAAAKTALKELFDVDTTQLEKTQLLEELGGKNILMAVNEVCNTRGLTVVSDLQNLSKDPRGPSIFQAKYTVEGKLFEGIPAASKKSARVNAAKLVMKNMFDLDCDNKDCVTAGASSAALISSEPKIRSDAAKLIPKPENIVIDSNKNAISLLNELCVKCTPVTGPTIPEYEMVSEQLNRTLKRMSFTVRVVVGDKTFEGSGTTKKLAKFRAAKEALRQLFDVKDIKDPCATTFVSAGKFLLPSGCDTTPPSIEVSPMADLVADLVKAKFTEICEANSILPGKEIAGFVVTRGNIGDNLPDATVVSIGGGTKCIAGGNVSREGASIHDCHAEILARRGLIMYFYQQLFMLTNPTTADLSIFESRPGGKGYRLKENVQLHLFITSAPCGDSRIFSMQDEVNPSLQVDLNPLRKSRAVLRVKLENGCGTISLLSTNLNPLQTFDAIVGGERFLCLSCSDKVLKWNVLGLQGALLSHFVEPIYLSTLVLGSLFHQAHVVRSCFERIAPSLKLVSPGFRLNQHCCSTVSCPEPRTTVKAPNTAYCWSIATSQLELITQELGKTLVGEASRVCKRRFFEEFHRIYGKLSHLVQVDEEPKAYCDAKRLSHEYEVQKLEFYRALKESNCGVWAKKPPEVDDFSLPNSD